MAKKDEINNPQTAKQFEFNRELKKSEAAQERFNNLAEQAVAAGKKNLDQIQKQNSFERELLGTGQAQLELAKLFTKSGKLRANVTKKQLETAQENLKNLDDQAEAIKNTIPGIINFADKAAEAKKTFSLLAKTPLGILGIIIAIGTALANVVKEVTETRKELGVSAVEAAKITAQTKALGFAAKAYGLDVEDIKSAQAAIRNDLGASVQEAVKLSLSFARTSAATGQTAEELSSTLSIMESISSASRDVLLNQIRTNAAMIEAAGVAPALVMKDIATNAEFFAQFAKDGGMNIINAGVAARKLGLEMSAVASISESLLDFESSIEKQMEASLLLGRQINLDKARQLALSGDQEGVMKEILKAVGGEAEFNKMNVIQRKALADSVGVNVEQLSRLVRNNTAGATGAAAGAAMGGGANPLLAPAQETVAQLRGLRKDITNA